MYHQMDANLYMATMAELPLAEASHRVRQAKGGSSILGASLNLSNSIIGAGCIGYGGAIAGSGGVVSILIMAAFAYLTKLSFDVVIALSLGVGRPGASYEDLGGHALGPIGRYSVMLFRWLFSFGCLVAYIIIVKDNFSQSLQHLLELDCNVNQRGLLCTLLDANLSTLTLSASVMLPLCLLRSVTPLERFSALKVTAVMLIVVTVAFLFFTTQTDKEMDSTRASTMYRHWFQVRPGVWAAMGTFLFAFVSQHVVNIVYESLRDDLRNLDNWGKVSTISTALATFVTLPVGLFAYMTFWEETDSNLFLLYGPSTAVAIARLLLCLTMLLTYPMPFFSCREVLTMLLPLSQRSRDEGLALVVTENSHLISKESSGPPPVLPPTASTTGRMLSLRDHVGLTVGLWAITVVLALLAPSLGDVLNLVGCVSGTMTAFILPGLFSIRLHGWTLVAAVLLFVGGFIGMVGTYFTLQSLLFRR